jgi:hypothetical protein
MLQQTVILPQGGRSRPLDQLNTTCSDRRHSTTFACTNAYDISGRPAQRVTAAEACITARMHGCLLCDACTDLDVIKKATDPFGPFPLLAAEMPLAATPLPQTEQSSSRAFFLSRISHCNSCIKAIKQVFMGVYLLVIRLNLCGFFPEPCRRSSLSSGRLRHARREWVN